MRVKKYIFHGMLAMNIYMALGIMDNVHEGDTTVCTTKIMGVFSFPALVGVPM